MKPRLLLHAVRTARPRQLKARLVRPLARRRFPVEPLPPLEPPRGALELWRSAAFEHRPLTGRGPERLRAFHAQYGDDVLAAARAGDAPGARAAIEAWIDRHPPRSGDAWHPYPLSTRAGNWIAALALEPTAATRRIAESLWRQLLHLERNVENDILGNHVIRNARGLMLGGAAFGSSRLLGLGTSLLARELPEQVLPDGGHYERSPVYHLLVLRDLLEIESSVPGTVAPDVLDRMRRFAAALTRPDGRPALFNDGTLELAPQLELADPPAGLIVFPDTGYAVWRDSALWLAFDCGPPSPPFLPAHAHADVLSFQLWADGRPVVVDPGMSTYEAGPERDFLRGTEAHATVAVGGDQFELWGSFRSGRLPAVELLHADEGLLEAEVEYRGVRHRRRIERAGNEIVVSDWVQGAGEHQLTSVLPLAARLDPNRVTATLPSDTEPRFVSERLYVRDPAQAVVMRLRASLPVELGWRIRL